MSRHRITIPNWHPATVNDLMKGRWHGAGRKRRDRELIAEYASLQRVPEAEGRRRVSLEILLKKGQRAPDEDAYWKSLLDGLVQAGLLTDDNRLGVKLGDIEYSRSRGGAHQTVIVLEDLDPAPDIPTVDHEENIDVAADPEPDLV